MGSEQFLSNVTITNERHNDEALSQLLNLMAKRNGGIRTIKIRTHYLSDRSAATLARLLALSSDLEVLDLTFNLITTEGYRSIARALHVNSSLRTLLLYGNAVLPHERDEVDEYFAAALRSNSKRPDGTLWLLYSDHSINDYARITRDLL
jgi:Ran GTPase-activating protein (RanGAP) involved in mRNA processing and transport